MLTDQHGGAVNNTQLYLAIGVPILANAALIGLLLAYLNAKFENVSQRFDDIRTLWLAELHRVEEVLNARLRHLEQR
jgi:hypothetical protein